jgi:predicted peroxiredoxin
MTKILFNVTNASNDPTKATLPFIGAASAVANGDEPEVALLGEGAYLAIDSVANAIHGIGFPPLSELFATIVEHEVPVYV